MDVSCDLEVDVNGEEVFMVNKKIISFYSGRISKLFAKSKGVVVKNLKVIFNDFPGGSDGFELMTRFCYNNGKININPLNVSLLHCIAHFMEMKESVSSFGTKNLLEQTDKLIEEIKYWTWSELMFALKQCQDLQPVSNGSGILVKYLDAISRRILVSCETTSPSCLSTASPDSSAHRLSCDTRSTPEHSKNSSSSYLRSSSSTWWFEDLVSFDPFLIEMLVKLIYPKNIDHGTVSKFIFYYQKSRFAATAKPDEKCKIMESVVRMLYSLDTTLVSLRSLFGILRVSLNLNCSKCSRNNLETMIGSQLDQATLDDLLIPSPAGSKYLYNVNLVLRFLKSFIGKGSCCLPVTKSRKVASLMDLYIAEVAPDPCLKPSKFLSLIKALPDSARTSYDAIYQAIDIYFKVHHSSLSEEEALRVCSGLNYEKLSSEVCNSLTRNPKFPSKSAVQALITQQFKLRNLLQETTNPAKDFSVSPSSPCNSRKGKNDESCEQIVLYAGKLDLTTENENLKVHLQGMQWRVLELEKVCQKMQIQMGKMMKSKLTTQNSAKSLPRLCS